MEVLFDLDSCPTDQRGSVVTIGAYDGVHIGHRRVLAGIRERAERDGLRSTVITFDRHPAEVVRPESAPLLLCDLDTKLELLASTGVESTLVITFNEERAAESAADFVVEVLVDCLRTRHVVVGADFHFGRARGGNVASLREAGRTFGFTVLGHDLVGLDGRAGDEPPVSSTAIRAAVLAGEVESAAAMLGRAHRLGGPVVHGDRRGRLIGFPTANVAISERFCRPADGIYAGGLRRRGGEWMPAAIYIGARPTFYRDDDALRVVEAHCLVEPGDLYDELVDVRFDSRIRGDQRFDGVDSLAAQLRLDCEEARRRLGVE